MTNFQNCDKFVGELGRANGLFGFYNLIIFADKLIVINYCELEVVVLIPFAFIFPKFRNCNIVQCRPKSHGLVVGVVACRARGLGFNARTFQKIWSPRV